jgi:hypothetical protein
LATSSPFLSAKLVATFDKAASLVVVRIGDPVTTFRLLLPGEPKMDSAVLPTGRLWWTLAVVAAGDLLLNP